MCEQYHKGLMTGDTDQLNPKLALTIPEQESAETAATTVSNVDATETADQLS